MLRVAASPLLPSVFILYLWLIAAVKCYLIFFFFYSVVTFHPHYHISEMFMIPLRNGWV